YLFYILRAADALGSVALAIGLYLAFNVVYAAAAYPLGHLADRVGKPRLIAAGALLFALSSALLVATPSAALALASFLLLGVAFAATEGVQRAFAADLAGSAARGTRLGWYQATVGVATILGALVAGLLWDVG